METMNYNRVSKRSPKIGIATFLLFTVLGTGIIIYSMVNEEGPEILGKDLYIPVSSSSTTNKEDEIEDVNIEYSVESTTIRDSSSKFTANIIVPSITIDGEKAEEINSEIVSKFKTRYDAVKEESANKLENKFNYKVTFKQYENTVQGKKMISFTFYERIVDVSTGEQTTYKLYTYNIDLASKQKMCQNDVAVLVLGSTYRTLIRNQIKSFVVDSKMISEEKYNYSITGLEEYYVKNNQFHIIFNPGELVNIKYGELDITITK